MAKFPFDQFIDSACVPIEKGSPTDLVRRYYSARRNLLSVVIFSTINVIAILLNANFYFLFSATVPYYLPAVGMALDDALMAYPTWTIIAYGGTLLCLLFYLLCWMLCEDRPGWMIAALAAFSVDSLVLLGMVCLAGAFLDSILDLVFHAWVLYYLISAVRSYRKLKGLLVQSQETASVPEPWEEAE